jgi:beta-N-acetylglucosaminidase
MDNQYQGPAALTGSRSDVVSAYPGYAANDNTAYTYTLTPDLTKLSYGNHTLKVVATGIDGSTTTQTKTVVKLSPILTVSSPVSTMPYANYDGSSDIQVNGWALDDSIVNNVSVTFDGNTLSGVAFSQPSVSDVQASYPQYPGSSSAKFSAVIPKGMLSNGIHIISVTSKGTDGVTQTRQIAITVGGSTYNTSYSITLPNLLTKEQTLATPYGFSVVTSDLDPNTIQGVSNGYEFMSLKYGLGGTGSIFTAAQLETMILAKAYNSHNEYVDDILSGHAQAFIDAANTYGINPVYLVAHARVESGNGTSILANGQLHNDTLYYNMYGIDAYDGTVNSSGLIAAYTNGWDSVDKAITGGAQWIATHYINSVSIHAGDGQQHYDQDTLYEMKWDPCAVSNFQSPYEYATEPDWASCIAGIMYQNRNLLTGTNMALVYDIPKYN